VRRVDADFERLQPIAIPVALERERIFLRGDEAVEVWKSRRLAGAQIGEQHAALLHHRAGAQANVLAQAAARRLCRGVDALAIGVVQPAVERAAQAGVLESAVGEVRAAMRAMALDQPISILRFEKNQIFSEDGHGLDRPLALHLVHHRDRLPIAPKQLPRRRARADAGHQLVLLLADHSSR
jgi:hypothetical protein